MLPSSFVSTTTILIPMTSRTTMPSLCYWIWKIGEFQGIKSINVVWRREKRGHNFQIFIFSGFLGTEIYVHNKKYTYPFRDLTTCKVCFCYSMKCWHGKLKKLYLQLLFDRCRYSYQWGLTASLTFPLRRHHYFCDSVGSCDFGFDFCFDHGY